MAAFGNEMSELAASTIEPRAGILTKADPSGPVRSESPVNTVAPVAAAVPFRMTEPCIWIEPIPVCSTVWAGAGTTPTRSKDTKNIATILERLWGRIIHTRFYEVLDLTSGDI